MYIYNKYTIIQFNKYRQIIGFYERSDNCAQISCSFKKKWGANGDTNCIQDTLITSFPLIFLFMDINWQFLPSWRNLNLKAALITIFENFINSRDFPYEVNYNYIRLYISAIKSGREKLLLPENNHLDLMM